MNRQPPHLGIVRERLINAGALIVLLAIGALALVGPSGLLKWGEDSSRLEQHRARIALLEQRQVELENRRDLLDPDHVDPDLASELAKRDLGVAYPDEYVIELDEQP